MSTHQSTGHSESVPTHQWYVQRDGKRLGPFSFVQLQKFAASGRLSPSDLILQEGRQQFTSASTIPGLFSPEEKAITSPPPRRKSQALGIGDTSSGDPPEADFHLDPEIIDRGNEGRQTRTSRRRIRSDFGSQAAPSKYPIARIIIRLARIQCIMMAALWPVVTIYIAVGTDLIPILKFGIILGVLIADFLIIVQILFLSELLQAFLDIAKNTQETAESVRAFAASSCVEPDDEED